MGEANKVNKKGGGKGKKQLLRQLANIIHGLPNRQTRCEEQVKKLEDERITMIKAEKVAAKSEGSSSGGGNRKKKGKKKKKECKLKILSKKREKKKKKKKK